MNTPLRLPTPTGPRGKRAPASQPVAPSFSEFAAPFRETGTVHRGVPLPLGAREVDGGVNFAFAGRHASRVQLELFAHPEDSSPSTVIELDPVHHRTGDIWHVWVKGLGAGQLYSYRVADRAYRMADELDPYATAISPPTGETSAKCVVTPYDFDWQGDAPPRHPWSKTVIYETHLRGLTADPSSAVTMPGTFGALTEKIPYLKELGVTTVEVLPIQEFSPDSCQARDPRSGELLRDDWGYGSPFAVFAPNSAYSAAADRGQQVAEFKHMVRSLHLAGLELMVDIAFPAAPGAVGVAERRLIVDALRYWVAEMHVDGFRLDVAALLGRDDSGQPVANPRLLEEIAEDPVLRDAKLVTCRWDAAGAYGLGSFPERRWAEWNRRYRADVRRFWRGDPGMLGAFASRLCGSEDLYAHSGKGPEIGVNFVTSHEGFTLNDLVSYQRCHNRSDAEPDGEGAAGEYSANYGVEGPTTDPRIESLRRRQIRNLLLTLFVSRGVPMLLGGDEFRRTQGGNSNAWCQDNATSWYDWRLLQQDAGTHDFVKRIIALRREYPVLSREEFYTPADVRWFSPDRGQPDWADPARKALGCLIRNDGQRPLFLMFNAEDTPMSFRIPYAPPRRQWQLEIDTASDLPGSGPPSIVAGGTTHTLAPRSSVILTATRDLATADAATSARGSVADPHQPAGSAALTPCGCNPAIQQCAHAMGGDDPDVAYAAAMLWYQGYPDLPELPKRV